MEIVPIWADFLEAGRLGGGVIFLKKVGKALSSLSSSFG